jgi:hypothetical protein
LYRIYGILIGIIIYLFYLFIKLFFKESYDLNQIKLNSKIQKYFIFSFTFTFSYFYIFTIKLLNLNDHLEIYLFIIITLFIFIYFHYSFVFWFFLIFHFSYFFGFILNQYFIPHILLFNPITKILDSNNHLLKFNFVKQRVYFGNGVVDFKINSLSSHKNVDFVTRFKFLNFFHLLKQNINFYTDSNNLFSIHRYISFLIQDLSIF